MIKFLNTHKETLSYSLLALANLPFILLLLYTHQISDDFLFAEKLYTHGFWDAQFWWYNNWIGRYSSTFFISVVSYYELFRFGLFFILISFYLAGYYFFSSFTDIDKKNSIKLTICFTSIYLFLIPKTGESLYWLTGAGTYLLALSLILVFLGMLYRLSISKSTQNRFFQKLLTPLLLFFIVGFNEIAMLFIVIFLMVVNGLYFQKNKKNSPYYLVLLLIGLCSSFIVFSAPGTELRMKDHINNGNLFYSFYLAIPFGVSTTIQWIFYSPLLFFSLLYIPVGLKFKVIQKSIFNTIPASWLFVSLFVLVVLCCFPSAWAQGGFPPSRTMCFTYALFLIAWWFFVQSSLHQFKQLEKLPNYFKKGIIYGVLPILILGSLNLRKASSDLISGRAQSFQTQWKKRIIEIQNCNQDTCYIEPLRRLPKAMLTSDFSVQETYWINQSTAILYQKKMIRLLNEEKQVRTWKND